MSLPAQAELRTRQVGRPLLAIEVCRYLCFWSILLQKSEIEE